MQVDLQGKVALVTGAGHGIGRAIADRFAANGATVVYSDIDGDAASEAAAQSARGFALRLDVSDAEQVQQGVDTVLERQERLDILVNNAGINTLHHRVNIDKFPLEEWDRIVRVDLTGLFLMSQAAAVPMLAQGSGRIINIASVVGLVPLRLQSAFVAAKGGVVNLTRSMALELGSQGVPVAYPGCHGLGVRVVHPVNAKAPATNLGLVMFYLPPHTKNDPGSHETEETYVILEGRGTMTFAEGRQEQVEKGMFVYLPPWCEHGIENTGTETLVVLIATSPPNP